MIEDNYDFSPRDVFYYGNELYDHELYEEAIEQYKKLLEMNYGWYEDKINACGKLADYYNYIKDSFNAKNTVIIPLIMINQELSFVVDWVITF